MVRDGCGPFGGRGFSGRGAFRGRGGFRPIHSNQAVTPPNISEPKLGDAGFTMRDEARNTASHGYSWTTDAKLWKKPVSFISASAIKPLNEVVKQEEAEGDETPPSKVEAAGLLSENVYKWHANNGEGGAQIDMQEAPSAEIATPESTPRFPSGYRGDVRINVDENQQPVSQPSLEESAEVIIKAVSTCATAMIPAKPLQASENGKKDFSQNEEDAGQTCDPPLFVIGTVGDKSLKSGYKFASPVIPASQTARRSSESSEDVVLFKGRKAIAAQEAKGKNPRLAVETSSSLAGQNVSTQREEISTHLKRIETMSLEETRQDINLLEEHVQLGSELKNSKPLQAFNRSKTHLERRRRRGSRRNGEKNTEEDEETNEAMKDYMENIKARNEDDLPAQPAAAAAVTFTAIPKVTRDLGGSDGDVNMGSDNAKCLSADEGQRSAKSSDDDSPELAESTAEDREAGSGDDEDEDGNNLNAEFDDKLLAKSLSQNPDAYDDWSQPRLQLPRNGRRSKQRPTFNVSDSELEAAMQMAWQNDREKKKRLKVDRELLRAQGLLGKGGKRPKTNDLLVRYPEGMSIEEIRIELKHFILSNDERIEFPPLDKHARQQLHCLVRKLHVMSHSTGQGDLRRPVFFRKKATICYPPERAQELMAVLVDASSFIRRRFFQRPDKVGSEQRAKRAGRGGSGGRASAATVREGEIVGASAKQIGKGNRGRAMLEKMGWSTGMGLGTKENKGILEPVAQVVKRSKAGLG